MTATVPFTPLEEAIHYLERKSGPWNVQFEVASTERLDAERLRDAALAACNAHPLARARQRHQSGSDGTPHWEIPDAIDGLPPETVTVADDFDAARKSAFHRTRFDGTGEVPVRLLVHRGGGWDGGDRLHVSTNHVAADGIGGARYVRSVCRAYRGEPLDSDAVDLGTARSVLDDTRPFDPARGVDLLGDAIGYLGDTVERPARIAGDGGSEADGWLFECRRLDAGLTDRVLRGRPDGASVNDVMLAALHRCIDAWNRAHGEPVEKPISLMMPLNLRPRAQFHDVVGMFTAFESITTRRRDRRTPRRTLDAVVDRTREIKDRGRTTLPYEALKLLPSGTPGSLKARFPDLLQGPGRRFVDTAILSNLGRLPAPRPRLAAGDDPNLWFSPPSDTPAPVGIGVVTVEGVIHLCGRYRRTRFDADAATAFTDRFLDAVGDIVE